MKRHKRGRTYEMRTVHAAVGIFILLGMGCASNPCRQSSSRPPWVSVSYRTTDAVGLIQEVHFFKDGLIRLNAPNLENYCSRLSPSERSELVELLESSEVTAQLGEFGERLRYPECFVPEELTITITGRWATARVDALDGALLTLVERLEEVSREEFGQRHMISLVERSTRPPC